MPPANELKVISTRLFVLDIPRPIAIPIGVASAKNIARRTALFLSYSFLNFLLRLIPRLIAAGPL